MTVQSVPVVRIIRSGTQFVATVDGSEAIKVYAATEREAWLKLIASI